VHTHPEDTQYQFLLAVGYEGIGSVQYERNNLDGAIESTHRALNIHQSLVDKDNADTFYKSRLAFCHGKLGNYYLRNVQSGEALRHFDKAKKLFNELVGVIKDSCKAERGLSSKLHELSKLLAHVGDGPEALRYAQQAYDAAREPSPELLRDLAYAHHLTGDNSIAIEIATDALEMLGEDSLSEEEQKLFDTLKEDLERYREE